VSAGEESDKVSDFRCSNCGAPVRLDKELVKRVFGELAQKLDELRASGVMPEPQFVQVEIPRPFPRPGYRTVQVSEEAITALRVARHRPGCGCIQCSGRLDLLSRDRSAYAMALLVRDLADVLKETT
jgi:hypothetical protein